jgi:site-specific DNA recombinase
MKPSPNIFFGYARKSTKQEDRQILSIKAQCDELKILAEKQALVVQHMFKESESASTIGRPEFNDMLRRIERGEANCIVTWKLDRLARNFDDGGRIIGLLQRGVIREIRTFEKTYLPTDNVLMIALELGMANQYSRDLSMNIKRGVRQKLRNGVWPSRAPVGYLNDRNTRSIVVDPTKAPLVRKAFELYATGSYALYEVRALMNEVGLLSYAGARFSVSNYQAMFRNPFFYGVMLSCGELFEGKHEPIISKRLYDEVQAVMERKSKAKTPQLKPYLYRGLFQCGECGCVITTETQKGHNYLRCTKRVSPCTQKYVREEAIAEQVDRIIGKVALEAAIADAMVAELEKERETSAQAQEVAFASTKAALAACEKQIDLLLDMRLSEQIGEPEYVSKKHILVNRKAELRGKLESFEANRRNRFEPAIRFVLEAKHGADLLAEGNQEKKRDFLKKIGSNLRVAEKSLALTFKNPWQFVAEFNSDPTPVSAVNEFSPSRENWRRGRDSNPRYPFEYT